LVAKTRCTSSTTRELPIICPLRRPDTKYSICALSITPTTLRSPDGDCKYERTDVEITLGKSYSPAGPALRARGFNPKQVKHRAAGSCHPMPGAEAPGSLRSSPAGTAHPEILQPGRAGAAACAEKPSAHSAGCRFNRSAALLELLKHSDS
jgi:hypothetical protein